VIASWWRALPGGGLLVRMRGGLSMQRVVIASPKGGCGKTTLARNLAAAASSEGWSVATADLDMQRTLLIRLG
jgi:Mrp family chromosome partitioning ATPase